SLRACENHEDAACIGSGNGNSRWCYLMLAKSVGVESHAAGRLTEPATLDTSSMDIEFPHFAVNASLKPLKVSSLTFPPLATARPSFYQLGPTGAEGDRSTKSHIRFGLFLTRL